MANNCCDNEIQQGGTVIDVTLQNPIINGGEANNLVLTNPVLNGNVELDDSAVQAFCLALNQCIVDVVNDLSPELLGQLKDCTGANLTAGAQVVLCSQVEQLIQEKLDDLLLGIRSADAVQSLVYDAATARLTLTTRDIYGTVREFATNFTMPNTGVTLVNTTLQGDTTISGTITLSGTARDSLCNELEPCIRGIAEQVIDQNAVAGMFLDCQGAPRSAGTRLPSCTDMDLAISNALASLPALDVIKSVTYDETRHVLIITTQLEDGTEQKWEVNLSDLAAMVVVDNVTIVGDGTVDNPLRVNLQASTNLPELTQNVELPTDVWGDRTSLLGRPQVFLDLGGYNIPAYAKSETP